MSGAAELLHLTQPAGGLHLKRLATDTKLALFCLTLRGPELTRDGGPLLAKAEQALEAMEDLGQTARRITGNSGGLGAAPAS